MSGTNNPPGPINGRFMNPEPMTQGSMLEMIREMIKGKAQTTPSSAIPVIRRRGEDFAGFPASGIRVTWLGHSTSLVELDGHRFLLDPVWAVRSSPSRFFGPKRFFDPPLALDEVPALDAVLISHDHYDHLDRPTVTALARRGVPFFAPIGVGKLLTRWGIHEDQVQELSWWDSVHVGQVEITATPARHFSGRSPFFTDRNKTLWAGFALRGPEHGIYYAGDTAMFKGFEEIGRTLGPFDATLMEIGAYNRLWPDVHLGPEQAVEAFEAVRGGVLVPVHWATFDLATHSWTEPVERLLTEADRKGATITVPKPGESIDPTDPPKIERWWPEVPWKTAKENPIVSTGLTPGKPAGAQVAG